MVSTAGRTNNINVKDNQNGRKNMILIGEKKNSAFTGKILLFSLLCSVSCCSHFAESIPKQFALQIAS